MRSSTEIQEDLTAALNARRKAFEAQSYSQDSGQGKQTVTRANLTELNKTIRELQTELADAKAEESGSSGIVSINFQRY